VLNQFNGAQNFSQQTASLFYSTTRLRSQHDVDANDNLLLRKL
jgi:hypothetical protein